MDSVSAELDTCCPPAGYGRSVSLISAIGSEYWLPGDGSAVTGLRGSLLYLVSDLSRLERKVVDLLSRFVTDEEILAIE